MLKSPTALSADSPLATPLARPGSLMAFVMLILAGVLALPSFAQKPQLANASTIKVQVRKIGVGRSVKVKLIGGRKLRGRITRISEISFTVRLRKNKAERQVAYNDVAMVKDPGPIFWMLVGAAIVIVIFVAAFH